MPTHWTYDSFRPDDNLYQGDILEPTEDLRSILRQVHPHFLDPKYTAFIVITQSCDLVIRKGHVDTKYLCIAVIRPLEAVLHDFLSFACNEVAKGVYLKETKGDALRLLERVFNQNENALGLFYLHVDSDGGISIPSVALLRVTVTLRADHYETLRKARRGRLGPEFRSKLGWLIGNLYARVGTQDWSDPEERKKELEILIRQFIDADEEYAPLWVPRSWVTAAREQGVKLEEFPKEQISALLEKYKPPAAKDQAVEHVQRVIREILTNIDDNTLKRIKNRLINDQSFSKAIKSAKHE
jgi:hypothetical protein